MRTKQDRPTIRLVGIHNIRISRDVQSRRRMSMEHVHEFSEAMLRGDVFPPVVVFWDGEIYWLADGFHRCRAFEKAGIKSIKCRIIEGTRRDAIIFSAGANREFSIERTPDDKRRAARMLFADREWFKKSDSQISKYVGISASSVRTWRAAYCEEYGVALPETIMRADDREVQY